MTCNGEVLDATGEHIPMLLFTANVGSLFENYAQLERTWFSSITEVIKARQPAFVAFHFQEMGGKRIDDKIVASISRFNSDLCSKMFELQYHRGFVYFDDDMKDSTKYTALGLAYYVSDGYSLSVYDHSAKTFTACPLLTQALTLERFYPNFPGQFKLDEISVAAADNVEVTNFSTKTPPTILNRRTYCLKERYPQDFTKAAEFRKGHTITRWRVDSTGSEFNLINLHLFHDQSNLMALDTTCGRSRYADRRHRALVHSMGRIHSLNETLHSAAASNSDNSESPPVATFLFGDLNLRLSLLKFLTQVQSSHDVDTEWVSACTNTNNNSTIAEDTSSSSASGCNQCNLPASLNVRVLTRYPSSDPSSYEPDPPSDSECNNNDFKSLPSTQQATAFSFRDHLLSQAHFKSASANCSFDCDNVETPGSKSGTPTSVVSAGNSNVSNSLTAPLPATKARSYSTNSSSRDASYATTVDGNMLLPPDYSKRRTSSDSSEISQQEHVAYLDLLETESRRHIVCLKRKHFDWLQSDDGCLDTSIMQNHKWLRQFDEELLRFHGQLFEADIEFPPSYPRSEEVFSPSSFAHTRAPAWCDRVIMNDVAHANMTSYAYDLAGAHTATGDHKPVYLSLDLRASIDAV